MLYIPLLQLTEVIDLMETYVDSCAVMLSTLAAPWYQENGPGFVRTVGAMVFPVGLVTIVVSGADLFTRNVMVCIREVDGWMLLFGVVVFGECVLVAKWCSSCSRLSCIGELRLWIWSLVGLLL